MVRDAPTLPPRGGLGGWLASLSPRDQAIYGGLLAVLLIIIIIYGALGVQLLLSRDQTAASSLPSSPVPGAATPMATAPATQPQQPATAPPAPPTGATPTTVFAPDNLISDGSFEGGLPSTAWEIRPSDAEGPICSIERCTPPDTAVRGPFSGKFWLWFGQSAAVRSSAVTQQVEIPHGKANLTFWLTIPTEGAGDSGFLQVTLDGVVLFSITDSDARFYGDDYQKVSIDVSSYADGATHAIEFYAETEARNGNATSFFVDDVSLVVTARRTPTPGETNPPVSSDTAPPAAETNAPATSEPTAPTATAEHLLLYFTEPTATLLIPVSRPVAAGAAPQQLEAAMQGLIEGPAAGSGLERLLAPDTQVRAVRRDGGTVTVDLDRQPGSEQALTSIALTLTEFPGVHQVEIQVNGSTIGLNGSAAPIKRPLLNPHNPDNLPEAFDSGETSFLPLYFRYNGYDVRVTRLVSQTRTPVKATLEALLEGPQGYADLLTAPVPPGTELRPSGINPDPEERRVVVDLTQRFVDAPDPDAALNALVLSLTELRDSEGQRYYTAVEVLVEGSSLATFWGEGYAQPFERPLLNPEQ
jgi:spore germination protein GerM